MTLPLLICNIVPLFMTEGVAVIRFLVVLLTATVLGCGSSGDQNDPDAQAQRDTVDATSDLPDLNSNDQDTTGEHDFTPQDLDSSQDDTKPEIICHCKNNDDCATAFADLDQCERAICNPNSCSCERAPKLDNFPCDDGDACTFGDKCIDGACKPGENQCECATNDDCAGLEDGNLCNGTLICDYPLFQRFALSTQPPSSIVVKTRQGPAWASCATHKQANAFQTNQSTKALNATI